MYLSCETIRRLVRDGHTNEYLHGRPLLHAYPRFLDFCWMTSVTSALSTRQLSSQPACQQQKAACRYRFLAPAGPESSVRRTFSVLIGNDRTMIERYTM